jgi:uncharacterized protein (DUF488 family)
MIIPFNLCLSRAVKGTALFEFGGTMQLFTFGYLSSRAERIFAECIALRIPCVDIRYSPTSNKAACLGETLCQRDGIIYYAVPELGNKRYVENLNGTFQEAVIEIANLERGLDILKSILDEHGKAAIFCACASWEHCHRGLVADEAHNLFGLEIVHLPVKRRKA